MKNHSSALSNLVLIAVLLLAVLLILLALPVIEQPASYHRFADTRDWGPIANVANVLSNLPLFMLGVWGLWFSSSHPMSGARTAWQVFFLGVTLVAPGSIWYHWTPGDASLVWDRLPMTLGFMALLTALLVEPLPPRQRLRAEYGLLPMTLLIGLASVLYWHFSGDLRPYIWVQLAPLLCIALLFWRLPAVYSHRHYLLWALGFYGLAKLCELFDKGLFAASGQVVSGHTLKHLLSAVAIFWLCLMLRQRKPIRPSGSMNDSARLQNKRI